MDALVWNGDFDPDATISIGGTNILKTNAMMAAYDTYLRRLDDPQDPIWGEALGIVEATAPRAIGISAYSASYRSAAALARVIKQRHPEIPVVLGGVHATVAPQDSLTRCSAFDAVVIGEAENSAPALFKALVSGEASPARLESLRGIGFRNGDRIVLTEPAERVEDLDSIPWPARHLLVDLDRMPPAAHQALYGFRGCPFKCIFCASFNVFGRRPRMRSAASMVDEIEHVHKTYGTHYFYICDDIFLLNKARVRAFCGELRRRGLHVYYSVQTRGEMMDEELLRELKRTGCQHIAIGVEVGDETIRKLIKKGNTVDDMRRAARLIREAGLRMVGFFMFGFPWETKEQMQATVDLMEELDPCIAFPYVATPAPGTELLTIAQELGLVAPDVDLASFHHVSPEMGITRAVPREERAAFMDGILERFAEHNRRSLRSDVFRRPLFYWAAARDAGILSSPSKVLRYLRMLTRKCYASH